MIHRKALQKRSTKETEKSDKEITVSNKKGETKTAEVELGLCITKWYECIIVPTSF